MGVAGRDRGMQQACTDVVRETAYAGSVGKAELPSGGCVPGRLAATGGARECSTRDWSQRRGGMNSSPPGQRHLESHSDKRGQVTTFACRRGEPCGRSHARACADRAAGGADWTELVPCDKPTFRMAGTAPPTLASCTHCWWAQFLQRSVDNTAKCGLRGNVRHPCRVDLFTNAPKDDGRRSRATYAVEN
jgi:hypothetical protein